MKIMLVEDEAVTVMVMEMLLNRQGYKEIHAFASGEEALAAVETLKPDLILMDIMLAGRMTGIETTIEIKKHHECPVIYTTGYNDNEMQEQAMKSGAAAYLLKPIKAPELMRVIAGLEGIPRS
ncbi:MAG: response regulator [Clostridia bacterium]|jgi:CheY-like chemotaxis protein|nr:response regulator [Spirochaetia bacterium]